jgi:hypothetical protein
VYPKWRYDGAERATGWDVYEEITHVGISFGLFVVARWDYEVCCAITYRR